MHYVACTPEQVVKFNAEMEGNHELLCMDVVLNPLVVKFALKLYDRFLNNQISSYEMVREMILHDSIVFLFGNKVIQYTRRDLRKVLEKFEDNVWVANYTDGRRLIEVIDQLFSNRKAA